MYLARSDAGTNRHAHPGALTRPHVCPVACSFAQSKLTADIRAITSAEPGAHVGTDPPSLATALARALQSLFSLGPHLLPRAAFQGGGPGH